MITARWRRLQQQRTSHAQVILKTDLHIYLYWDAMASDFIVVLAQLEPTQRQPSKLFKFNVRGQRTSIQCSWSLLQFQNANQDIARLVLDHMVMTIMWFAVWKTRICTLPSLRLPKTTLPSGAKWNEITKRNPCERWAHLYMGWNCIVVLRLSRAVYAHFKRLQIPSSSVSLSCEQWQNKAFKNSKSERRAAKKGSGMLNMSTLFYIPGRGGEEAAWHLFNSVLQTSFNSFLVVLWMHA